MKLLEMMKLVDKSPSNETTAAYDELCDLFNIESNWNSFDSFSKQVKAYYLSKWLCTDSWVGVNVYFLNDELIACSKQDARKSPVQFFFTSKATAQKLKDFLISLSPVKDDDVDLLDLEMEVPETYSVHWCSQLLTKQGLVDGKHCRIIKEDKSTLGKTITVEFNDNSTKETEVDHFAIPYHIKKA